MHIKRLEIQGFKTFADRTELELSSGITSVVGPNGSGKSNIADAVSWVLGEQNVRNLRGVRAQDVIFSGSDHRKSLGLAEVSLTIDNSCGTLPVDFSEITVTRRVYRSGEGEYFINKSPCRLKDIVELFLDTGMGRDAYSMVSQGEIDAILSAKSEDRRSLFEEAAGIKKYRFRRKEASRKLERTEVNLRRVNDIVAELSGQVEPLAEQAQTARRYEELVGRLREIETGLLINDLRRWSSELDGIQETKLNGADRISEQDKRIADLEWEKEKTNDQLASLDHKLDAARIKRQEASAEAQKVRSRLALIEERQRSVVETKHRLDLEIGQLEERVEEAKSKLERLRLEESGCTNRESALAERITERNKLLEQATAELESAAAIVDDRKSAYIELAKDQASKEREIESLKIRAADLDASLAKYTAEEKSLTESRAETDAKKTVSETRAAELRSLQKAREDELPPLRTAREQARLQISAASDKLTEINRSTVGKSSRLATLKEMAEAHEGFFEGVRSVMSAKKAGKIPGGFAVVADVISIPSGFETAIDVALGSAVQDIVADTVDDAKAAIRFLKESRAGRATFLPMNNIRPSASRVSGGIRRPGVQGIASDIVKYDRRYEPAVKMLLGRVIVVDSIDDAVALSKEASGWSKIVTLDGEVIAPSGAMTGGARKQKGSNLLGRKQEIEALTRELSKLDVARSELESALASSRESLAETESQLSNIEQAYAGDRLALAEAERQAEFLSQELRRLDKQTAVVASEAADAQNALAADTAALAAIEAELSETGRENTDLDELVAGAQKRVEELSEHQQSLSEELMEMSVTLASVRERRVGLVESVKQTEASVNEMGNEISSRREQIERRSGETAANSEERELLEEQSVKCDDAVRAATLDMERLAAERSETAQAAAAADAELRTLNHARSDAAEQLRDADVRSARLEVQIMQTSERLIEEYEISAEEALARDEPEDVQRGTAAEVARLRKEIRAMGTVNTGAIQEYQRISERWEFLATQKSDLENARVKLLDAIKEIDEGTRDLFMTTFKSVGEHFDRMFTRLFGGGATELVLTDSSNLLETGIEIIVQPPGKKLQNMTLLSGGERALTACALLFALLMVRPSPFVLFDEVDAPLDDSNVERFADVLREFSHNSQFIVVTHNRATMEASDNLYGVTMNEPGVSKLISVRLTDPYERDATGSETVTTERIPVG